MDGLSSILIPTLEAIGVRNLTKEKQYHKAMELRAVAARNGETISLSEAREILGYNRPEGA